MKIINSLFFCILLMSCSRYNKIADAPNPEKEKEPQICVKDWGKMAMVIGEETWKNAESEIISQIGVEEYAVVRKKYDYKSVPAAMSLLNTDNRKNLDKFHQKLSTLKLHKVATFTRFSNGKNWGKAVILKVPYEENQDWDKNVKWDSVYIIINEEALEVI